MFRSSASRSAFRALNKLSAGRSAFVASRNAPQLSSKLCTLSNSRPTAVSKPMTLALARFASNKPIDNIDSEREKSLGKQKLEPTPETVSVDSSTHPVFGEVGLKEDHEHDADMMAGIKNDMVGGVPLKLSGAIF